MKKTTIPLAALASALPWLLQYSYAQSPKKPASFPDRKTAAPDQQTRMLPLDKVPLDSLVTKNALDAYNKSVFGLTATYQPRDGSKNPLFYDVKTLSEHPSVGVVPVPLSGVDKIVLNYATPEKDRFPGRVLFAYAENYTPGHRSSVKGKKLHLLQNGVIDPDDFEAGKEYQLIAFKVLGEKNFDYSTVKLAYDPREKAVFAVDEEGNKAAVTASVEGTILPFRPESDFKKLIDRVRELEKDYSSLKKGFGKAVESLEESLQREKRLAEITDFYKNLLSEYIKAPSTHEVSLSAGNGPSKQTQDYGFAKADLSHSGLEFRLSAGTNPKIDNSLEYVATADVQIGKNGKAKLVTPQGEVEGFYNNNSLVFSAEAFKLLGISPNVRGLLGLEIDLESAGISGYIGKQDMHGNSSRKTATANAGLSAFKRNNDGTYSLRLDILLGAGKSYHDEGPKEPDDAYKVEAKLLVAGKNLELRSNLAYTLFNGRRVQGLKGGDVSTGAFTEEQKSAMLELIYNNGKITPYIQGGFTENNARYPGGQKIDTKYWKLMGGLRFPLGKHFPGKGHR